MNAGVRSGILIGTLLMGGGFGLVSGAAEEVSHTAHETVHVVYRLYYSGIPVGEVTEVWTSTGDAYRISSEAQPYPVLRWVAPSFQEISSGSVAANTLLPSHFEHRRSDGTQALVADFHWDTGELVQHFDGKTESVALPPGTQDMLSIKYLSLVAGVAMLDRDIPMSTGKRLEIHHLVLQDEEDVDSPAGHFKTRHVVDQQPQAPSRFELWLPEDPRYPPVRMQVHERDHEWEQRMLRVEIE